MRSDIAWRMRVLEWLPCVPLVVMALLPLRHMGTLDWLHYVQVWCICAGLGYLLCRRWWSEGGGGGDVAGVVLALGYLFVAHQFGGDEWPVVGKWGTPGLIVLTFAGTTLRDTSFRLSVCDWVAIAVGGLVVSMLLVTHLAAGSAEANAGIPWPEVTKIGISLLLWFAVRRVAQESTATQRSIAASLVGGLAVVSLAGLLQISSVAYYRLRSDSARAHGDTDVAIGYLKSGLAVARRLELDGQTKALSFRMAAARFTRGEEELAAEALGLCEGFVDVVTADAWDGPEGGNLYYKVSCWKSIQFLPGKVEIRVYASGNEVDGEWPEMRVELDGRPLGNVWVTSGDPRPYRFVVDVPRRSEKQLSVYFVNDFYQATPHVDRNLKIGQAELHYLQIYWD